MSPRHVPALLGGILGPGSLIYCNVFLRPESLSPGRVPVPALTLLMMNYRLLPENVLAQGLKLIQSHYNTIDRYSFKLLPCYNIPSTNCKRWRFVLSWIKHKY